MLHGLSSLFWGWERTACSADAGRPGLPRWMPRCTRILAWGSCRPDAGSGAQTRWKGKRTLPGIGHRQTRARRIARFRPFRTTMPTIAKIDSLDHEGRGVTRVEARRYSSRAPCRASVSNTSCGARNRVTSRVRGGAVLRPSAQRTAPRCPHYGVCGGCSMQHLDADAQAAVKAPPRRRLRHIGKLRADRIPPAIHGPAWGYRYRARLGVRRSPSKGGLRVGFPRASLELHRRHAYLPVLPPAISALLPRRARCWPGCRSPIACPRSRSRWARTARVRVPQPAALLARRTSNSPPSPTPRASRPGSSLPVPDSARPLHPRTRSYRSTPCPEFDLRLVSARPTSPR